MSQCLIIMAKRLRDYIPVMLYIKRRADFMAIDFTTELRRFAEANQDVKDQLPALEQFLKDLDYSGQKLEDWDFDLTTLPHPKSENWSEEIKLAHASLNKQQRLKDEYKRFVHDQNTH